MRILTLLALFGLASFTFAEEKKEDKKEEKKDKTPMPPLGKYVKKGDEFNLTFEFKKDNVVIFKMSDGTNGCEIETKAKYEKDSLVKCTVEKFEKLGTFPVEKEKGYEFSLKWKLDGKKLVVTDFEGTDINDEARKILEGDYELTK